jgi:hypothetical protein
MLLKLYREHAEARVDRRRRHLHVLQGSRSAALNGDDEVLVVIRDGSIYTGSLQASKLAPVVAYVAANTEELLARWATYGGG